MKEGRWGAYLSYVGLDYLPAPPRQEGDGDSNPEEALARLREELGDCQRCPLGDSRRKLVFGDGDPRARLVFVGEAPGAEEDRSGVPFVGRAGELLDRIIAAMGLKRGEVYICNVLKCRPPGNRDPLPEEIERCIPFLQRQLEILSPEVICTLGSFATNALLGEEGRISRMRSRFHSYRGIPLMPTYHPSYLLRNPERKRDVWEDVRKIMEKLGLEDSRRG